MNDKISKIVHGCDRRYLLQSERERILEYANSVHCRIALEQEIERCESKVLDATMRVIRAKYPQLDDVHEQGYEHTSRDLQLAMRCIAQAVLIDDIGYLHDRFLIPHRQVLRVLGFTPAFVRDVYGTLRDELRNSLSGITFDFAKPYLDELVTVLSDFPQLEDARVGR
ncbi:MAG: hypothetical protein KDC95_09390 [Planctomycetes bacterium]|nr:hypothetical protein [Planctomycetota bacterium]